MSYRLVIILIFALLSHIVAHSSNTDTLEYVKRNIDKGNYIEAFEKLNSFISDTENEATKAGSKELSQAYKWLGYLYLDYDNYYKAADSYEKALSIADSYEYSTDDEKRDILLELTVTYCFLKNAQKAEYCNKRIRNLNCHNKKAQRHCELIGNAYIEKYFGNSNRSAAIFKELDNFIRSNKLNDEFRLNPISELCEYYDKTNQTDSLSKYLTEYETLIAKYPNPQMVSDFHKRSMRYYIKTGNRELSLLHSDKYISATDSVMKTEKFLNTSSRFEKDKQDKQNTLIGELEFKVSKLKLLLSCIVLAAVIIAVSLLAYRHRKQLYIQL